MKPDMLCCGSILGDFGGPALRAKMVNEDHIWTCHTAME
jgi:hypothetical protein